MIEKRPRDGDGGDTAGLSDGDETGIRIARAVKNLRKLSGLAGTSFSDDDNNGVVFDGLFNFVFEL